MYSQSHKNRAKSTPITINWQDQSRTYRIDQSQESEDNRIVIDQLALAAGDVVKLTVSTEQAEGTVHLDAVQFLPID